MRISLLLAALLIVAPWSASAREVERPYLVREMHLSNSLEAHLVWFDRTLYTVRVIDLIPGMTVAQAVQTNGGMAGVNGGYFQPNHEPMGLVVSQGVQKHPMETAKILTGVLAVTPRGTALLRNAEFKLGRNLREALQAGPFLVDHGKPVTGLNATRRAERTVLLAEREGVMALLITAPVTLAELAQILAAPDFLSGLKIDRALNLDGGSSTALWVATDPAPYSHPEWKAVRNAVAIVPMAK